MTVRQLMKRALLQTARFNYMAGIPGETPADFQNTLKFILKLKKIHPALEIVFHYYIPIPQTRLAEEDIEMGLKVPNPPQIRARKCQVIYRSALSLKNLI
jgi:tRNA A37 methylthiotransferase MiaB